jgi:DME family drug/metabolite transporter
MVVVSASLRARSGVLAIGGGAVLWGTTGVVAHAVHVHTGLSGPSIAFYRVFSAALVVVSFRGRAMVGLIRVASRRQLGGLILAGATLGVSQGLYFVAVADAGVSLATLICIGAAPIAVALVAAVSRRRWPTTTLLATLAAALAGLVLITASTSSAPGPHATAGVLAALGAGLAYATSTVLSGPVAGLADSWTLTGAASVVGSLTLAPVAVVSGLAFAPDAVTAPALLYLGVVPTVLAYGLFFGGLRTTSTDVAAVLTLLEPLAATVLAVGLLGETLTVTGWLGAGLLLAAVGALLARPPVVLTG